MDGSQSFDPKHRKWRRIHGFQLPLHPQVRTWMCGSFQFGWQISDLWFQQIVAWLVLVYFAVASFSVLLPYFDDLVDGVTLYILHAVRHKSLDCHHFLVNTKLISPSTADHKLQLQTGESASVPKWCYEKACRILRMPWLLYDEESHFVCF